MNKAVRQTSKPSALTDTEDISKDTESGRELIQSVLAKPRKSQKTEAVENSRINGVVIGTLSEPGENGQTMVCYPGMQSDDPLAAITTENMTGQTPGREIALGFVDGNPSLPIILGLIQTTGKQEQPATFENSGDKKVDVQIDGDQLTLSAEREIVLKCGKSSITLTRAGKVILKGAYLSTHSTGVNRIKGGSVQIN
jgi:hypothetical protein